MTKPVVRWADLYASWEARDARYRQRRQAMTDEEAEAIRATRKGEIGMVEPEKRSAAFAVLMRWRPPRAIDW